MKHIFLALIVVLGVNSILTAQDIKWEPTTKEVKVEFSDSMATARVLIIREDIKTFDNLVYYWYSKGIINSNTGDYAGDLLHGKYMVFNKDKKLITKGEFEKGLKTGAWKKWNSKGNLLLSETYENGLLDGDRTVYDNAGKIHRLEVYRNGEQVRSKDKSEKVKTEEPAPIEAALEKPAPEVEKSDSTDNTKKTRQRQSRTTRTQ